MSSSFSPKNYVHILHAHFQRGFLPLPIQHSARSASENSFQLSWFRERREEGFHCATDTRLGIWSRLLFTTVSPVPP